VVLLEGEPLLLQIMEAIAAATTPVVEAVTHGVVQRSRRVEEVLEPTKLLGLR
jgi:hypothetical protein